MGWKRLKQQFNIEGIVQVEGRVVAIGAGYLPRLISICLDTGELEVSELMPASWRESTYRALFECSPGDRKAILDAPDTFDRSIPVYGFAEGVVTEHQCEKLGYPNCTHDGRLMFANRYFATREEATTALTEELLAAVALTSDSARRAAGKLAELQKELATYRHQLQAHLGAGNTPGADPARATRTHELKTLPTYFAPVRDGVKPFEVRRNDRDFQAGDLLVLREWDPEANSYTGESTRRSVTYVLGGGQFGLDPRFCVLGLADADAAPRVSARNPLSLLQGAN